MSTAPPLTIPDSSLWCCKTSGVLHAEWSIAQDCPGSELEWNGSCVACPCNQSPRYFFPLCWYCLLPGSHQGWESAQSEFVLWEFTPASKSLTILLTHFKNQQLDGWTAHMIFSGSISYRMTSHARRMDTIQQAVWLFNTTNSPRSRLQPWTVLFHGMFFVFKQNLFSVVTNSNTLAFFEFLVSLCRMSVYQITGLRVWAAPGCGMLLMQMQEALGTDHCAAATHAMLAAVSVQAFSVSIICLRLVTSLRCCHSDFQRHNIPETDWDLESQGI